jgi:uncharacterized protein YfaS (alpha-2-macroglobulin family)
VDKLVNEQKFEAAATEVQKIREAAQAAGDEDEWTKALIREVQLRTALHGYETSVRFLKEQPWPKGSLQKDVLQLFYAWSLVNYFGAYQYEIQQRERVATTATVDLKAWTADQIYSAAHGAYAEVWKDRDALGKEPVAKLATYLEANNYPKGVRGTLRDAVSYLLVELLADTRGWSPAQSNDLFQLPFAALLKGDPARSAAVKLEDGAVHPMVKIAAVLDDLETWHAEKKEREGALEARLERLRRLFASFSEDPDRDAVEKELAARLEKGRDVPWWAMGKAQLARFVMARGKKGALVRARSIAMEGEAAWPHEVGGLTCRSIVKQIEAPDFQVQSMQSDGMEKRSIQVTHKNLGTLHFRAYAVDLQARLASSQDYNLLPSGYEMKKLFGNRPAAEWKVELPATPDYKSHLTFVTPPLVKKGLYAVVASARADFAAANNRIMGVDLIITDLAMTARQDSEDAAVDVQVFEAASGKPAGGAEVTLYRYDYSNKHHADSTKTVDGEGMARFQKKNDRGGGGYFLLAKRGEDYALDTNWLGFWARSEPQETTTTLTYTDRSIYRPLQKVLFKVIAFRGRGDQARYRTLPETPLTIFLRDANGQEVAKQQLKTNSFGSAAGELAIPAGRLLGMWSLQTSYGGYSQIRVEEYKRPTFEASFKDPKDPLRLNRPATLTGEVKYYFGLPVTNGQVRWRVTREPVWPFWWFWYYGAVSTRAQTIATGNATLGKDGTFNFTFTPAADERKGISKEVSWRYSVTADVTDEGGETRSATRGFRLGFTAVEAQVQAETAFFREGQKAAMKIRRTDLDGVPRAGKGRWRLVSLSQPKSPALPSEQPRQKRAVAAEDEGDGDGGGDFETPGDKLRPRWEASYSAEAVLRSFGDGAEKANGALVHDDKGEAAVPLPALSAGAWRIHYETQDDFGATYKTQKEFVVAGKDVPVMLPAWLAVEETSVKVGGTARLVALSGFPGQTLFLDLWHNGRRYEHRRLEAGKDGAVIEIPIKEQDRGGFGITLTVLRDHQIMTFSSAVFVPWDDRELKLEFATFRDKLRPGAKETFRVTVKGPPGAKPEAAGAELLAYMYDKSLDVFAPHNPPSPMGLWPSRTGVSWAHATLGPAYAQYIENRNFVEIPAAPSLSSDRLKMESGYGIGGPGYRSGHGSRRLKAMAYKGQRGDGDELAAAEETAADAPPAASPVSRSSGTVAQNAMAGGGKSAGPADKLEANKKRIDFDDVTIEGKPEAPLQLRSNFAETAFFQPALLAGADGSATIEFQVPDSVTAWNVWVHAVTKDLTSGSIHKETRSVKELMVRPYVPRFLREGDQAELKVVVNDASDKDLAGKLTLSIEDPDTHEDIAAEFGLAKADLEKPFKAEKGGGANVSFALVAPKKVRMAAVKLVARAGEFSDGELRPVPVLPSRMHLIQSRFVTLRDKDKRTMTFDDLKTADPTRINDQMVVTVDAQLFYTVLESLPYLIEYPYECTEQTLNRFVSTAIVTSVFRDFPAVAKMAEEMAKKRDTPLETFAEADPNRKMALEESPWLNQAQGGKTSLPILKVLDPKIASAQRESSLNKLKKAQTANGGFPWFPGGPPDPYMTLYIMYGFAKASEFKADVPKDVVQRGWQYLASHFHEEYARHLIKDDCCWEWLTFLNYVASSYPDPSWVNSAITEDERKEILDFSFKHWKKHSPYLKGLLALTLKRAGRPGDAKLVWASVMDSAKTKQDEGTYWAAEDRSWLWYNDTIETHAFALRTLLELEPANPKKDGLVLWLLLNKKLNQWKSTKATAEVIYSLVHYLKREKALGIREDMKVSVGGQTTQFVFEPDKYTGKNQIVVPGEKVSEATSTVTVEKQSKGFAFASTTWHFSTEKLPDAERGDFFNVKRTYFKRVNDGKEWTLQPLADGAKLAVGDELEVQISLRSKHPAEYVHLRDPRGAGFEPSSNVSRWKWDYGTAWYEEVRDSGTNFFFGWLPQGEYTFKYRVRASMAGTFRVGPATVQSMYAPEFNAYSAGNMLSVAAAK